MATIKSFVESFGVLRRNPILFAIGALYAVIVLPQTALSTFGIPIVPWLFQIVTFFITPFVIAGLLAMAYEGRVRDTSFETFKKVGKDRYAPVLIGNLIQAVFSFVYGIIAFIVAIFVVGFGAMAMADGGTGGTSDAMLGGLGIVSIVLIAGLVLFFLLVMFFIQFYATAIVVDDVGVVDGFRNSVSVVLNNILEALGFGVINLVIGLLVAAPVFGLFLVPILTGGMGSGGMGSASAMDATQTGGLGATLLAQGGIVVYSLLSQLVLTPFRSAFSVSFYDNHTEG
ncbi:MULTISPECIES: DUF7847 domain-containing protein [Halomicrobium]|uniref:DUF7847 domain-containing protein n=2 Tax=Halomicrobium mukohataei TaxID=57705 RepID=C7NWE8_HALMD|nr:MULTISPECIES: hypothetical protein [Halomicrobium]ACV46289.1 hypothetical protein Hmuk_0151 [Halomicrobium mukohataei DSM 12286]QCD64849.1 hypothetical protein E5139_04045 [Halomicrobium mukohataei]QFR19655.1 hypothetical protein GBQ70_04040 [Halomicrobium sp. ZPS1]